MTLHSKAAFARIAGVTRTTIGHAIKVGLLVPTEDGRIDAAHPLSVRYLERRRNVAPASGKNGTGHPVEGGGGAPILGGSASGSAPRNLAEEKLSLDVQLRAERVRREHLRYLEEVKAVIPLELYSRGFSLFTQALVNNFRVFASNHADELCNIAADGRPRIEFREALDREVDTAIKAVLKVVHAEIGKLRPLGEHVRDVPELQWLARLACPKCGGTIAKEERAALREGDRDSLETKGRARGSRPS